MHTLDLSLASWRFRDATRRSAWRPAAVPGCVHTDLRRAGEIPDPFWGTNELDLQWIEERDWEYRARFSVAAEMLAHEVVELVADGLDTVAVVSLNGHEVARTENMFTGHRWDVKRWLRRGRNELLIRFDSAMNYIRSHRLEHQPREINDPVGRCVVIRKQQCQFGWDWGPRFVTAGVWRGIRLEAWSLNRLESVRVMQTHAGDGSVALGFTAEFARPEDNVTLRGTVSLDGRVVGTIENRESKIENPRLWWPNGHGAQPLYDVAIEAVNAAGERCGSWRRRIGLRTIALDRHADEWGETFRFVVNGRPIFAKGANWIPAHSFVAGLTRADYARDLAAAAQAHMNMIRVWGGGIYESDDFYDLCDELGLLVWQDFMFACTLYPADAGFLASVRAEVEHQARRLRHRASLALWCGNNEVFGCNVQDLVPANARYADYEQLFHRSIPAALAPVDAATPYWPGSPWRGDVAADHAAGEARGDTHFWDVWHARQPVKTYEKYLFRFVSEFGMQSYSSPETNATFCSPHCDNVFGPEMENHQKNRFGNQVILDYVSRLYRFPQGEDALIYLSQLNQAYCMQVGVEHWRRHQPRCMGALYWQLNDCWPVASWSSIEFTGRWKALHHVARRFFAPAIVTARLVGEETTSVGNYRRNAVRAVELFTACDDPQPARGVVRWDVFHLDGRRLRGGRRAVALNHGESVRQTTVDVAALAAKHGVDWIYLRIALDVAGRCASEDTVFLTAPRFLELPRAKTKVTVRLDTPTTARLRFTSDAFQHRFAFDLRGLRHASDDNYFELYPGEPKEIRVTLARRATVAEVRRRLSFRSLVDTY